MNAESAESRTARETAEGLWQAVTAGDEYTATRTALTALDRGMDPETLLLDVIAPVQRRIGGEWAANRLTVAQEHAATAINDRIVAALVVRTHDGGPPDRRRGTATVACVDGEWHALPARLLAEVLTLRGWHVDYLGAQVPTPHLIRHLHRTGPDVVALSSSIATRLPAAHAAITACQALSVPVLAGGAAFGEHGQYARLLGADVWAPDARAAADRLEGPLPVRRPDPHQPVDDLPHLADQEYTLVARSRPQLVKAMMTGLEERLPAVASYTELQRQHTAEDCAHIVDFLATALYTDDDELFSGFITWTASILAARHVPAATLPPTLDLLGAELRDLPRALRVLAHARDALAGAVPSPAGHGSRS
ncbi:cobalamin-dependent protein [Streptomyces sp. V4-01]|uniref:Cobalamin-dependent protein n=1 Tax=Actinacidiphila polyblastidii TaxID=3110430 RepID=A0ABU7P3P6_9ACTN|nr:cobalamin-dependent protein [Streptomyces sp. V4-01]